MVSDSRSPFPTQGLSPVTVEIVLHLTVGDRDLGNPNWVRQTGLDNSKIAKLDGDSISRLGVKPYPQNQRPIQECESTAILEVSR